MTRYETPGWDESVGEPTAPEPPDVADLMLWRDAQRLFGRHAGAGQDGRCVWCGCPWPCPPRRLAERAEAASRRPWWNPRSPYQEQPAHPVSPAVSPGYPVSPAVSPGYPVSPAVSPGYPVSPAVSPASPGPAGYHAYPAGPAHDAYEPGQFEPGQYEPGRAEMGHAEPVPGGSEYDGLAPDSPVPRSGPPLARGTPSADRNRWADLVNYAYPMR